MFDIQEQLKKLPGEPGVYLMKDENDKIYIQNGALEYCDKNYDILKIVADNIEGGIDSINERWKRYDKNIYDV